MRANPFDHNGECTYCDELGEHAADCPWWLEQLKEHAENPGRIAELLREVGGNELMNQLLDDVANDRAKTRKP